MSGLRIFVVDDEQPIADLLSNYLRKDHNDVETFYEAQSVLKRADQCLPDILVADIVMPDMSGVALAEVLRERRQDCKVVLISGNPEWGCPVDLRGDNAENFVVLLKPFKVSQLVQLVRAWQDGTSVPTIFAA